jgi:hypothetical protein
MTYPTTRVTTGPIPAAAPSPEAKPGAEALGLRSEDLPVYTVGDE